MSSNEKEILYNNQKTILSIPQSFQEFKELCIQTFYISKQRSENMVFKYYDEDKDVIIINSESFGKDDCKKAKFWILSIDDNTEDLEKIKKECLSRKSKMLKEANLYKQKLLEECKPIIESKINEKNKQHQDDLKMAKENYVNSLKEFKSLIDQNTKNVLAKISEKLMSKYLENVKKVDEGVKSQLNEKIDELIEYSKKSFDDTDMRKIGIIINQFKENLDAILKGKEELPFLIENEIIKDVDSLNEKFSISIIVLNQNVENTNDDFELEITPNDKIKLDLSGLKIGEFKLVSINLEKKIQEFEKGFFTLKIFNKNNQISNDLKLTFQLRNPEVLGTNEDMLL